MQTAVRLMNDTFLEKLLNRDVYRLSFAATPDLNGDKADVPDAQAEKVQSCLSSTPVFAYAKVPATRIKLARYLEKTGFRIADTLVEFRKNLSPSEGLPAPEKVRLAKSADAEQVQRIAGRSFHYSRFHMDPKIPNATANLIKSQWATNYFKQARGDCMLVSLVNDVVSGFTLLLFKGEDLIIDLIAVDPEFRRTGSAGRMLAYAERSFPRFKQLIAGTQIVNAPSIAMYAKARFRFGATSYVFHYHQ